MMSHKILLLVMGIMITTSFAAAGEFGVGWRSCISTDDSTECIELEFLQDGVFKANGKHANGWISYETGTFHFETTTGELFVNVANAGLEWPVSILGNDGLPLYQAEIYVDYQRYFKIVEQSADTVTVLEFRNSYREANAAVLAGLYDPTPVWATDGTYDALIAPLAQERLLRTKYHQTGKF